METNNPWLGIPHDVVIECILFTFEWIAPEATKKKKKLIPRLHGNSLKINDETSTRKEKKKDERLLNTRCFGYFTNDVDRTIYFLYRSLHSGGTDFWETMVVQWKLVENLRLVCTKYNSLSSWLIPGKWINLKRLELICFGDALDVEPDACCLSYVNFEKFPELRELTLENVSSRRVIGLKERNKDDKLEKLTMIGNDAEENWLFYTDLFLAEKLEKLKVLKLDHFCFDEKKIRQNLELTGLSRVNIIHCEHWRRIMPLLTKTLTHFKIQAVLMNHSSVSGLPLSYGLHMAYPNLKVFHLELTPSERDLGDDQYYDLIHIDTCCENLESIVFKRVDLKRMFSTLKFPKLKMLKITDSVNDEKCEWNQMPKLKILQCTGVSDANLGTKTFPSLKILDVGRSPEFTGKDFKSCGELEKMDLRGCRNVTDEMFERNYFGKLVSLKIHCGKVTGTGWKSFSSKFQEFCVFFVSSSGESLLANTCSISNHMEDFEDGFFRKNERKEFDVVKGQIVFVKTSTTCNFLIKRKDSEKEEEKKKGKKWKKKKMKKK